MARIEYLGHAGLAIEHRGQLLLCDPWLSETGAFNASWFPYPEYPHPIPEAFESPDAIYISHEHQDHFDADFLSRLDSSVPILTGRFNKKRLRRKLLELGFEQIIELDNFENYQVGPGFEVEISRPTFNCPSHYFDSCAVIKAGDLTAFNMNDCNQALNFKKIRDHDVDIFFAQASPAIWFPLVYENYSEEEKADFKQERKSSSIQSFIQAAKFVDPDLAVPFAGPPIFFDPDLEGYFLEEETMFNSPQEAADALSSATDISSTAILPGDCIRRGRTGLEIDEEEEYADFDYDADREDYHRVHREEKQTQISEVLRAIPEPEGSLFDPFRAQMEPLVRKSPYFRSRIDMRVLFDVRGPGGGKWVLDLRDEDVEETVYRHHGEPYSYRFTLDSRFVGQVLRDEMSWEDLFLSFRFEAHRDPDIYNFHLHTFLKMADLNALKTIAKEAVDQERTETETFTTSYNGQSYEIQRFCPHAGGDLRAGHIEDGKIVCPSHHWEFSLDDGSCVDKEYDILCRRIDRKTSEVSKPDEENP